MFYKFLITILITANIVAATVLLAGVAVVNMEVAPITQTNVKTYHVALDEGTDITEPVDVQPAGGTLLLQEQR